MYFLARYFHKLFFTAAKKLIFGLGWWIYKHTKNKFLSFSISLFYFALLKEVLPGMHFKCSNEYIK